MKHVLDARHGSRGLHEGDERFAFQGAHLDLAHLNTGLASTFVKESKENVLAQPSGITYAIPITYAKKLLDDAGVLP